MFRLVRLLFCIATAWTICLPDPPNLSPQELDILKQSLEEYISSFSQNRYEYNSKSSNYGRDRYYESGGMMNYPRESFDMGMQGGSINYGQYPDQMRGRYYHTYGQNNMYENGMSREYVSPMPYTPVPAERNHVSNEHYVSLEDQKNIDDIFYKSGHNKKYKVRKSERYFPEVSDKSIVDTKPQCSVSCYTHAPVLTNNIYGRNNPYGAAWRQMYVPGFLEKMNGYDLLHNQGGGFNVMDLQDLSNQYMTELEGRYGTDRWRILQEIYSPEYLVYLQRLYGPDFLNSLSFQSEINNGRRLRNYGPLRGDYWQLLFRPEYNFYGIDDHIDEYLAFLEENYPMLYFRYMQNPQLYYQYMPFPWFGGQFRPYEPNYPIHKEGGYDKPPIDSRFDAGNKTEEEVKEKQKVPDEKSKKDEKSDDVTEVIEEEVEENEDGIDIGQRFDDDSKKNHKHKGKHWRKHKKDKNGGKDETKIKDGQEEHKEQQKPTEKTGEETKVHALVEERDKVVESGKEIASNGGNGTNENSGSNITGEIQTKNSYGEGSIITNTIERHPQRLTLTINIPSETVSKKVEVTHPAGYEYSETSYKESGSEENGGHGNKGGPIIEVKTETGPPKVDKIIEVSKDPFISHPPETTAPNSNGIFSSVLQKANEIVGNVESKIENAVKAAK